MGQVLHGCGTKTNAARRAKQHCQERLRALAKRYGINQKTFAKWRRLEGVAGRRGQGRNSQGRSRYFIDDEAIVVALSAAHATPARRLTLRAAGDDPAFDVILPASLSAAA